MPAPKGNHNAARGSQWRRAVEEVIEEGGCLKQLATMLVAKAMEGDMVALREIGDRLDGKPRQIVEIATQEEITIPNEDTLSARLDAALAGRAPGPQSPVH